MCWVFFSYGGQCREHRLIEVNWVISVIIYVFLWKPIKKLKQESSPTPTFPKIFSVEELLPKMRKEPEVNPCCLHGEPKQKSVLLMWKKKIVLWT